MELSLLSVSLRLSPKHDDTDSDDGVSHERSDGHHVDQVLQVEEGGHEAGEHAGEDGGAKRSLELRVDVGQPTKQKSVR